MLDLLVMAMLACKRVAGTLLTPSPPKATRGCICGCCMGQPVNPVPVMHPKPDIADLLCFWECLTRWPQKVGIHPVLLRIGVLVQVAFVSFCVATVFFRTHLKKHDLNDGNKYLGLTFQALVWLSAHASSEGLRH